MSNNNSNNNININNNNIIHSLPTWTSDTHCSHHGNSLSIRVGLTHENCLLFEPADFTLHDVTCLVGTNGSGKSSLARVLPHLPGFPSQFRVEYVSTDDEGRLLTTSATQTTTPLEYLHQVVQEKLVGLQIQIEELENNNDDENLEEIANQLAELYEQEEALMESSEQEIQKALEELGFSNHLSKTMSQLSSGWRYKCRLIGAFLIQADLLIIDEPSFLDAPSMQWLISKIRSCTNMVLLISHKETLLEALADRILYLNSQNKTLKSYHCGYQDFRLVLETERAHAQRTVAQGAKRQQNAQHSLQDLKKQLHKRETNLKATTGQNSDQRFIKGKNKEAKQKADKSAASKVKQIHKKAQQMEEMQKQSQKEHVKPLRIDGSTASGVLASLEQLAFAHKDDADGKNLLVNVDAQVNPQDRILLQGPNGCGKTTLVRLILGELQPSEGKLVSLRGTTQALYFPQTAMSDLVQHHGHLTAVDYFRKNNLTETMIRQHLGNFGLMQNVTLRSIASLSAGQRVRLWLAAQVLENPKPSLLIMDEISENVDIETRDSLLALLDSFVGAVLVISHDPDFCQRFHPTQIWTLHPHGLHIQFCDIP